MPPVLGQEFRLGPQRATVGALLIHGFTGTPFEVRLLGESLANRGIVVRGPALRGHATRANSAPGAWPAAPGAQHFGPWIEDVDAAFAELQTECDEVMVCGLSMGGLLAIELAARWPRAISRLALLACAIEFPDWLRRCRSLIRHLPGFAYLPIPKLAGSDIADREMKRANDEAQRGMHLPIGALLALFALAESAAAKLPDIVQPTLAMHGRHDHTIPLTALDRVVTGIERRQGKGAVETKILENSFHILPLDLDRQMVFDAVRGHFRS